MAQLIEPDGTINIITTIADAIEYCNSHPGWSWQQISDDYPDYGDWE